MNRRELLRCLAAGGVVTAEGLWWPGRKLISIPKATLMASTVIMWADDVVSFDPVTLQVVLRARDILQQKIVRVRGR